MKIFFLGGLLSLLLLGALSAPANAALPQKPYDPQEAQSRYIRLQIAEKKAQIIKEHFAKIREMQASMYRNELQRAYSDGDRSRIPGIFAKMKAEEKKISQDCQRQIALIDDYARELNPKNDSGSANIHVHPLGSNLYVRNYVNYVPDPTPPPAVEELRAVAGKLPAKK